MWESVLGCGERCRKVCWGMGGKKISGRRWERREGVETVVSVEGVEKGEERWRSVWSGDKRWGGKVRRSVGIA